MCDTIFMSPAMQCNKRYIVQTEESLNIFFLKNNSGQGKKENEDAGIFVFFYIRMRGYLG